MTPTRELHLSRVFSDSFGFILLRESKIDKRLFYHLGVSVTHQTPDLAYTWHESALYLILKGESAHDMSKETHTQ